MEIWRDLTVVVPFRLASSRFPDKALARFRGLTLVEHALRHGAQLAPDALVLTGPAEDLAQVERRCDLGRYRCRLMPSRLECGSATERLVEIFPRLEGRYLLSLPVDEPAIDVAELQGAIAGCEGFGSAGAITFYCDFYAAEDYLSNLSAKIVTDRDGLLLYMSRAVIPIAKAGGIDAAALKKNVGAFLFTRAFLEELERERQVPTALDRLEGLEQLRWLELGLRVRCLKVRHVGFGVDVPEQLALLERRLGA
jgi:3-deoxy-manno-octulosonate cytidylyltransferase (CMP-KDO synthetase)